MLLDKTGVTNTIYVTVSEKTDYTVTGTPQYNLILTNDYTNEVSTITLTGNTSEYPARYDSFIIAQDLIADLIPGTYTYQILQTGGSIVETGKAVVIDSETNQTEFETITPDDEDQILVFE